MQKRIGIFLAVVVVALFGCNSLNVNNYTTVNQLTLSSSFTAEQRQLPASEAPVVVEKQEKNETAIYVCPPYRAVVLPRVPSAPIKELEALGPNEPAKVNELERKYMQQLRNHINAMHTAIANHEQAYLASCKKITPQK